MKGDSTPSDVLRSPRAGALVIRGGSLRILGYAVGIGLGAATSVFLLRGLGVDDFGRYATVAALLAVVSTFSDAGLTAIGDREVSLRSLDARTDLLRDLVALRVGLTLVGILVALVFAVVAGYSAVLIEGIALGGLGVLVVNVQATMMLPLAADLKVGSITIVEIAKSATTLLVVAALAIAGASLLPYFAVQIVVGVVALALTPKLVGAFTAYRPRIRRASAIALLRDAAPVAVALALNVLYLRLLVVLVSLSADERETGLYGTAFRVVELFIGIPPIVVGVAIPLLAVAGAEDLERLRYGTQRLLEVAVVASLGLALVVSILAKPALKLLGGTEYVAAAPMLQIQAWALVPLAAGSVITITLLSLHRQRAIAYANALALVVVVAGGTLLIAAYGGKGAAVTGVLAESTLLCAALVLLARAQRQALPQPWFIWRPLVALAAGAAMLLVPLGPWLSGIAAGVAYVAVALVDGAVPGEIRHALLKRAPGDRE